MSAGQTMQQAMETIVRQEAGLETVDEYVARNKAAMDAVEARILSPEYMNRYTEIMSCSDPAERDRRLADLKRENYATLDIAALHRTIRARNKQMFAEGVLPPPRKQP
jgi:hypothetical protein